MAFIGFFLVFGIGVFFVVAAITGAYVTTGFAGKIEWPHFIVCMLLGGGCLWYAIANAPFKIIIGGAP